MREIPQRWRDQSAVLHAYGRKRCPWTGAEPDYIAYHDEEWGRPEFDSRALYEKLVLDGFQAGLSWITILRKRDAFRHAFDGFAPEKVSRYDEKRVALLMNDARIVRNRAKILGAVASAQAWLAIEEKQSFSNYIWGFVDGRPIINHPKDTSEIPASTELSKTISKDLKARGFKFCGETIVYAFMQAVGIVDDHLVECCMKRRP
jgi:DNA-3-methyladenine glycosylase I